MKKENIAMLEKQKKENESLFKHEKSENFDLFAKEKKANEQEFNHEKSELKVEAERQLIAAKEMEKEKASEKQAQ
jgi:hypothetical protein